LPFKKIECLYASNIVITSHSLKTAKKWASILAKFSTVKGVIESTDEAKINKGTSLLPTKVKVWRTYSTI
jgi:hypothetical protein